MTIDKSLSPLEGFQLMEDISHTSALVQNCSILCLTTEIPDKLSYTMWCFLSEQNLTLIKSEIQADTQDMERQLCLQKINDTWKDNSFDRTIRGKITLPLGPYRKRYCYCSCLQESKVTFYYDYGNTCWKMRNFQPKIWYMYTLSKRENISGTFTVGISQFLVHRWNLTS